MIDSSGTVEPTGGFDLEAARDLANNPIHCPETDEVFRKCVTEIERLRGFETAARDLSNDLTRVAKERDELQEANTNFAFQASDQAQEIEITELKADLEQSERVIDQQAARIGELEAEREKLGKMVRQRGKWLVEERANKMIQADDCTQNEDAADFHHRCICEYNVKKCPIEQWWLDQARITLQAEGKIGPDAETSNGDHIVGPDQMIPSWQITEERKAAIDRGLQFLEWSYAKNSAHDTKEQIAVLWAMLDEVGQEIKNIKTVEI